MRQSKLLVAVGLLLVPSAPSADRKHKQPMSRHEKGKFVAFAYTYHYLNWFSKTKVILWHQVSHSRLVAMSTFSVVPIAIYGYDYETGLWIMNNSMIEKLWAAVPVSNSRFTCV